MFKFLNSKNLILNVFSELFNLVTSNLNITDNVYLSQDKNISTRIQYIINFIILNNIFKALTNQYGNLGGFSIIFERIFQGFYLWLTERFALREID